MTLVKLSKASLRLTLVLMIGWLGLYGSSSADGQPGEQVYQQYRAGVLTEAQREAVYKRYADMPRELLDAWMEITLPAANPPAGVPTILGNQKLAQLGYVDVTAAPFHADNTGKTDTTKLLQDALNFARDYQMAAFLPAGDYRVSDTILLSVSCRMGARQGTFGGGAKKAANDGDADGESEPAPAEPGGNIGINFQGFNVVVGSTADPEQRARIVLAANSPGFDNVKDPKFVVWLRNAPGPQKSARQGGSLLKAMVEAPTIHYDQIFSGIDITVEPGNPGAVGLRHRGAEGCAIMDSTIDVTHGYVGIWGVPASGGSTHKVTIIGGDIGIDMRGFPKLQSIGVQPSPSFSQLKLINQRRYAMWVRSRGATVIAGASFVRDTPGAFIRLEAHWFGQPYDSLLTVSDSMFEFASMSPDNVIVERIPTAGFNEGQGFYFNNVFARNVALAGKTGPKGDAVEAANPADDAPEQADQQDGDAAPQEKGNQQAGAAGGVAEEPADPKFASVAPAGQGWHWYRELAVANRKQAGHSGRRYFQGIFIDGKRAEGRNAHLYIDEQKSVEPPADLLSKHGWGGHFPSFETPGAVPVTQYRDRVQNGDWAPAFQAAIDAHEVVFVPLGEYPVRQTIRLKPNTKLIGVSPIRSQIKGIDVANQRFVGCDEGRKPQPIIATSDDPKAQTVIAFVGVYMPQSVVQHGITPVGCYPLLWRSGSGSMVRMGFFGKHWGAGWRFETAVASDKRGFGLRGFEVPFTDQRSGVTISSDTTFAKQLLLEDINNKQRLMTKFNREAGAQVKLSAASGFDLKSLELSNATFEPGIRFGIDIEGKAVDGSTQKMTVDIGGQGAMPRERLLPVNVNWGNMATVTISAPQPFGVGTIVTGKGAIDIAKLPATKKLGLDRRIKTYGFEHYPYPSFTHPLVLITGNGGGRWYNFWYHGDIWGRPDYHAVEVRNTRQPLTFYNWHLQHVTSDNQAAFIDAHDVTVYGIKHEHNTCFLEVHDSDRIRIFGSGGLSNARTGSAHFKFFNTPNFMVAALSDQVSTVRSEKQLHKPDNPLVNNSATNYNGLWDVQGEQKFADEMNGDKDVIRPVLWRRGQPNQFKE